jgi:hypothetical protein
MFEDTKEVMRSRRSEDSYDNGQKIQWQTMTFKHLHRKLCLDRIVDVQFCENSARIGRCDEENIGLDPLFTRDNWNWFQIECKRSCKL